MSVDSLDGSFSRSKDGGGGGGSGQSIRLFIIRKSKNPVQIRNGIIDVLRIQTFHFLVEFMEQTAAAATTIMPFRK
jgi:hypothetical protein